MPAGAQRPRLAVPKALLLHTRLPRLPVLAGRCVFCCRLVASNRLCHQTYTLCRTVLCLLKARSLLQSWLAFLVGAIDAPVPPHTRLPSTHVSSPEAACSSRVAKRTRRRAVHITIRAFIRAATRRRRNDSRKHTTQLTTRKLEVHPREPLLPRQIDEALARERRLQQRRPRLIQFEPHASAIPPQYQGRPF